MVANADNICDIYRISIAPSATKVACFSVLDAVGIHCTVFGLRCPRDLYKQSNCLLWNRHQSHFLPNWVNSGFRYSRSPFCVAFKKKDTCSIAIELILQVIVIIIIIKMSSRYMNIHFNMKTKFHWFWKFIEKSPVVETHEILQLVYQKNIWQRMEKLYF